jgi:hypothetical protein
MAKGLKKLHQNLKASAPKRREGTGRTNPQEGIVDGIVRKRQEAKTFEKIGRATHAKATRPAVEMPMKEKPFKANVVGSNNDARGFASEVAATKPKVTVSERVKTTPEPMVTLSAPAQGFAATKLKGSSGGERADTTIYKPNKELGEVTVTPQKDWGSHGPNPKGKSLGMNTESGFVDAETLARNKRINERPRATGAIEEKSGHIFDAITLGQGGMALTALAATGYAIKKGTEYVIKKGTEKAFRTQAARVLAKDAAQESAKFLNTAAVGATKATTGKAAREIMKPGVFTPKIATGTKKAGTGTVLSPAPAGTGTVIKPATKAATTKKATDMSKLNASAARGEARVTGNASGNINQQLNDPAFLRRNSYNVVPPPATVPTSKTAVGVLKGGTAREATKPSVFNPNYVSRTAQATKQVSSKPPASVAAPAKKPTTKKATTKKK